MGWTKRWKRRLRALVRREAVERELDEELAFHLEMETEKNLRAGMSPAEARRRAALSFGGVQKFREEVRDARALAWVGSLSLDFRLGARMLLKYPGLTLVGGLALAFAIAIGAATFELVAQAVHPSLPFRQADRVVGVRSWDAAGGRVEGRLAADFLAWRQELRSVEDLGAFRTLQRNLITADGQAEPLRVAEMSAAGFRVARVAPLRGRWLVEEDELPGSPPAVVIGEGVWRARFGGDAGVIGRTVRLGGSQATVVGVMPEGFGFPVNHHLWIPLRLRAGELRRGEGPQLSLFGRLAPGFSLRQARAELAAVGARDAADFPRTHRHLRPQVMPYARSWSPVEGVGIPRGVMTAAGYSANAAVLAFLLLVCANVATLVFARAATREGEIVVRSALGASRGRIVLQLFAEALVLGAAAAVVGLAVAALGIRWGIGVFEAVEGELPFWIDGRLSPRTVLYTAALTVLTAAVAGVIPARKITGRSMEARLRQGAVGGATLRFGRLWTGIIVTQVAFTAVFLPIVLDTGLDTDDLVLPDVGFPAREYLSARLEMDAEASPARFAAAYGELERRLEADPRVISVTYASQVPGAYHARRRIEVEGGSAPPRDAAEHRIQTAAVDPGFLEALGAPVVRGRGFHPGDLAEGRRVVVVNESFVREVLGGRDPVGRRLRYPDPEKRDEPRALGEEPGPWYEIVGVARDVRLTVDPDLPHNAGIYHPIAPGAAPAFHLVVHTREDPTAFAPRLRAAAVAVDPTLRLYEPAPLDRAHRDLLATYTFWLRVAVVACGVVLLLSVLGIYAIMAFTVARRTREIGIRVALGADRRRIVASVFGRGLTQVGLGIAAGVALLLVMGGGVPSLRMAGLLAADLGLLLVACAVACFLPTRRALRVAPTEAMRADA